MLSAMPAKCGRLSFFPPRDKQKPVICGHGRMTSGMQAGARVISRGTQPRIWAGLFSGTAQISAADLFLEPARVHRIPCRLRGGRRKVGKGLRVAVLGCQKSAWREGSKLENPVPLRSFAGNHLQRLAAIPCFLACSLACGKKNEKLQACDRGTVWHRIS